MASSLLPDPWGQGRSNNELSLVLSVLFMPPPQTACDASSCCRTFVYIVPDESVQLGFGSLTSWSSASHPTCGPTARRKRSSSLTLTLNLNPNPSPNPTEPQP